MPSQITRYAAPTLSYDPSNASDRHRYNKAFTRIPRRSKRQLRGPTGELTRQQEGPKNQRGGLKRQRRGRAAQGRGSTTLLRELMILQKDSTRRRRWPT